MGGILAALATLAQPILARVLVALGFSVVTLGGLTGIVVAIKNQVVTALGSGPMAALQLAGLGGAWEALGLVFGAVSFSVAYFGLTKAVRIAGAG